MVFSERKGSHHRSHAKVKKKILTAIITLIILLLIGASASIRPALSQGHKSFLWKVRSSTTTVYLLGSIHFMKPEAYPLDETIENAYDSSEVLVVEANINDIGSLDLTSFMDRAFYQGADRLEKHVSPDTYRLIKKESGVLGIPLEMIEMQKPWFLALSLEAAELMKLGYDPQYGVDYYFLQKAQGKKRILELESLDEQIKLFSGFSEREQELFLLYTLKSLREMGGQVDAMVRAWASGDAATLESVLAGSAKEDRTIALMFEKLLDERNIRMSSRIEGYLGSFRTHFVIVGAGHLVGNRGIVETLRSKGYPVEQL